jgi:hypothetical protein
MNSYEVSYSPDRKHKIRFEDIHEIRMGPLFGKVIFDDRILPLYYGMAYLWSHDSKYLALQQWLSTTESKGPLTRITLIDLEKMKVSFFKETKGFVEPKSFEKGHLIFQKRIYSSSGEAGGRI